MNEAKKTAGIVFAHLILAAIACTGWVMFQKVPADLIQPFVTSWRIREILFLFTSMLPALQVSGLVVGYALAFSKSAVQSVERWSLPLLQYIKGALVLSLVCLFFYVVLAEGIVPALHVRQTQNSDRSKDYAQFIKVGTAEAQSRQWLSARRHIQAALEIWPKSAEAQNLLNTINLQFAGADSPAPPSDASSGTADVPAFESNMTVQSAMEESQKASREQNLYNAHYYAMLAYRLATERDPRRNDALAMASVAWTAIGKGLDESRSQGDKTLYARKKAGYEAIERKDYVQAYYLFLQLHNEQAAMSDNKHDTDIDRFLEVARKSLLETRFFIDETENLQSFEFARDIFFLIERSGGATDAVFIRGLTYTRSSGRNLAYLRGFEYATFNADNSLNYQFTVPYVKMFPYEGPETGGQRWPELLLQSVDRDQSSVKLGPVMVSGRLDENSSTALLLQMPFKEFSLIVAANNGPEGMSLPQLYRFTQIAEKYGFHPSLYMMALLGRLSDPFLILIISIYALTLGWKYRLGAGVFFKAWWILVVPLFPVLTYFLVEIVRYLSRLAVAAFVGIRPALALVFMLSFLTLWLMIAAVYFTSQRSE